MKYRKKIEIAKRCIALQLLIDRGWKDVEFSNDDLDSNQKKNSMSMFLKVSKWVEKEKLFQFFTKKEKSIYIKELGNLNDEEKSICTWSIEKLIPLLWSIGIIEDIPEFSESGIDNNYENLYFFNKDPISKILKFVKYKDQNLELVNIYLDAYMILNWRCKNIFLGNKKNINLREVIPNIFGEDNNKSLEILPLNKKGDIVIKNYNLNISELNLRELFLFHRIVENRQYGFEWLTRPLEDWDDITCDT